MLSSWFFMLWSHTNHPVWFWTTVIVNRWLSTDAGCTWQTCCSQEGVGPPGLWCCLIPSPDWQWRPSSPWSCAPGRRHVAARSAHLQSQWKSEGWLAFHYILWAARDKIKNGIKWLLLFFNLPNNGHTTERRRFTKRWMQFWRLICLNPLQPIRFFYLIMLYKHKINIHFSIYFRII